MSRARDLATLAATVNTLATDSEVEELEVNVTMQSI